MKMEKDVCLWKLVQKLELDYDALSEHSKATEKALDKEGNFACLFFLLFLTSLFVNMVSIGYIFSP